jgi:hypothetical protein
MSWQITSALVHIWSQMQGDGEGGGMCRGLCQWVQLCTYSPNKLWRSKTPYLIYGYNIISIFLQALYEILVFCRMVAFHPHLHTYKKVYSFQFKTVYCRRVAFPLHLRSSSTWIPFSPPSSGLFCKISLQFWKEHFPFRIFVKIACEYRQNYQMLKCEIYVCAKFSRKY